ncbi:unnamed protein product [Moneuplotes crassus]|uniref:Uncharacterized protein n=1 Tax=Euplotes crassus TaxID=5936 RepID=A0AAD1X496_EUPCR|nr:unnamed protein product [Moneuplotes crassus]
MIFEDHIFDIILDYFGDFLENGKITEYEQSLMDKWAEEEFKTAQGDLDERCRAMTNEYKLAEVDTAYKAVGTDIDKRWGTDKVQYSPYESCDDYEAVGENLNLKFVPYVTGIRKNENSDEKEDEKKQEEDKFETAKIEYSQTESDEMSEDVEAHDSEKSVSDEVETSQAEIDDTDQDVEVHSSKKSVSDKTESSQTENDEIDKNTETHACNSHRSFKIERIINQIDIKSHHHTSESLERYCKKIMSKANYYSYRRCDSREAKKSFYPTIPEKPTFYDDNFYFLYDHSCSQEDLINFPIDPTFSYSQGEDFRDYYNKQAIIFYEKQKKGMLLKYLYPSIKIISYYGNSRDCSYVMRNLCYESRTSWRLHSTKYIKHIQPTYVDAPEGYKSLQYLFQVSDQLCCSIETDEVIVDNPLGARVLLVTLSKLRNEGIVSIRKIVVDCTKILPETYADLCYMLKKKCINIGIMYSYGNISKHKNAFYKNVSYIPNLVPEVVENVGHSMQDRLEVSVNSSEAISPLKKLPKAWYHIRNPELISPLLSCGLRLPCCIKYLTQRLTENLESFSPALVEISLPPNRYVIQCDKAGIRSSAAIITKYSVSSVEICEFELLKIQSIRVENVNVEVEGISIEKLEETSPSEEISTSWNNTQDSSCESD